MLRIFINAVGMLWQCCENVVVILCLFLGESHSHATLLPLNSLTDSKSQTSAWSYRPLGMRRKRWKMFLECCANDISTTSFFVHDGGTSVLILGFWF